MKKRMIPIQENQQILEDEAFAEVLNEYRNKHEQFRNHRIITDLHIKKHVID